MQRFRSTVMQICINLKTMNWDDTRIFLALSRTHSLRAAARSLGIDQATVGRRLNALESELGAKLFLRAKDGYLLTAAGETALAAARRMESAAMDLRTKIEGQDDSPSGLVRVTSTDSIAIDLLLPAVERLQQHWPNIRVDLEVSTQLLSLGRRQADIAFRNVRPEALSWWFVVWLRGLWGCSQARAIWLALASLSLRTSCAATIWWHTAPIWSRVHF